MEKMLFIGGDKRMIYAAKALGERFECDISEAGLSVQDARGYDYAVLPLPTSRDGERIYCPVGEGAAFSVLGEYVKRGGTVFASKLFPKLEAVCSDNGLYLVNYYEREELAVLNAVPTAEGAVAAAINALPVTVNGLDVLITGYGRIGKITARYFSALGAVVAVSARKPSDLAWITAEGFSPIDFRDSEAFGTALKKAKLIINTVPFPILEGRDARAFCEDAALIELASTPCISGEAAKSAKLRVIGAGGLPGKLAPVTAGAIIARTIENILTERSSENVST